MNVAVLTVVVVAAVAVVSPIVMPLKPSCDRRQIRRRQVQNTRSAVACSGNGDGDGGAGLLKRQGGSADE